VLLVLCVGLCGTLAWRFLYPRHRTSWNRSESAWINSIVYPGGEEQTEKWRALGPEGIRMLARAVEKGNRPLDRTYRRMYPKLPAVLQGRLPVPNDHANYKTRLGAAALLCSLGSDAKPALPVLTRALRFESQEGVRLEILACFICLAKDMDPKEKRELLPELLRAMRDNSYAIRNSAAMVLKFYPEQAEVVVPVLLLRALHDPRPEVRLQAAAALDRVVQQAARKAEVTAVVLALTTNEDSQVAIHAKRLLTQLQAEAATNPEPR